MTQQKDGTAQKNVTYNASGLVTSMKDENNLLHIAFEYNERGKRAKKISYAVDGSFTTTWYVSDAAGNELSIYDTKSTNATTPVQTEIPIYGASRIGICTKGYNTSSPYALLSTNMNYELKDYLGNVRATISRNKNADGTANVLTWADYLAFGEVMRTQPSQAPGFNDRYGYQGDYAECDVETGWNSFDLRMYDPNDWTLVE